MFNRIYKFVTRDSLEAKQSLALNKIKQAIKCGKIDELKLLLVNERNIIDINARFPLLQNKTIIMLACESGRIDCVQAILDNGGDINREGIYYGDSTLTSACLSGNIELLHYLIDKGILISDSVIFECFYTLVKVKRLDYVEIIRVLLSHVQDINYTHNNESLLHLICKAGQADIARILLERGADRNAVNKDGQDALYIAANEGHIAVVKVILGSDVPADSLDAAFKAACLHGRLDVVAYLIERGATICDPNSEFPLASQNSLMQQACFRGHTGLVRLLLEHGCDRNALNSNRHDSLYVAAREGQVEVAKVLLEWSVGDPIPLARIGIAYEAACRSGAVEVAKYLIDNCLNVNYIDIHGHCPLSHALSYGRLALVTHLIEKGADVHATDPDGDCMLLIACKRTNTAAMRLLLEHGADPNAVDRRGYRLLYNVLFTTPLGVAAIDNLERGVSSLVGLNKQIAQMLVDHDADLNLPFKEGRRVLLCFIALQSHSNRVDVDLLYWLLDRGADINQANTRTGQTALMIAATACHHDLVKLLLERGADVTQLNASGHTVLDMLDGSWKYRSIIKFCKQYLDTNRPHKGLLLK